MHTLYIYINLHIQYLYIYRLYILFVCIRTHIHTYRRSAARITVRPDTYVWYISHILYICIRTYCNSGCRSVFLTFLWAAPDLSHFRSVHDAGSSLLPTRSTLLFNDCNFLWQALDLLAYLKIYQEYGIRGVEAFDASKSFCLNRTCNYSITCVSWKL